MIKFLLMYFDKIGIFLSALFGIYILKKNKQLNLNNQSLKQEITDTQKIVTIQNKVLDVSQNTKSTNLAGILERLRKNKL